MLVFTQELCLRCGDVELRPFDEVRVQISVDSSDVQHEKVVTRLISPYIKGFSVLPLKRMQEDAQDPRPKMKKFKSKKLQPK